MFRLPSPSSLTGYTLIELVIVMLILGILASVAAPQYASSLADARVEAAAKRIVADLALVRTRAIMKGTLFGESVQFFPSTDEYQMIQDPDLNRPGEEYWVNLLETAYPVDLVSATFKNNLGFTSNKTIQFDLYGQPRVGNNPNIAPMTEGKIIIRSGGEERTVVINPATGKASVP